METAIDRSFVGKEKEIHINDFDGYKGYHRFICPNCGEYVFPRTGKKNVHHFSHYEKNETSIECEKRSKIGKSCSFYEKVGLPIYLKRENDCFTLNIGFYALRKELLQQSQLQNLKVTIEPDNPYSQIKQEHLVDFTFFEDEITVKPLTFVPANGKNYKISLPSLELSRHIYKIWSDYADGFTSYGALFTYSESGGKKIRRNDTITTRTDYYLMISDGRVMPQNGVASEYCNCLDLNGKKYEIRKMMLEPKDENEFRYLENFFWESYRLKLLYNKPTITPLWPPSVQCNGVNHVLKLNSKNNSVFCKVTSDNDNPAIYSYAGNSYMEARAYRSQNNISFVNLTISELLQPFTIDRKYLANAVMLSNQKPNPNLTNVNVTVDGLSFNTDLHNQKLYYIDKLDSIRITSNSKLTIIMVNKNRELNKEFIADTNEKTIEFSKNVLEIWFYSESKKQIVGRLCRQNNTKQIAFHNLSDDNIFEQIKPFFKEKTIFIPRKYSSLLFKVKNRPLLYKVLKPVIAVGQIQPTILKILEIGGFFDE